jgi:RNA polymerase subunit RPABC4/transcription elongation factor Spt4
MAKERPTTKLCKHCKMEIPYEAKVCPNCRRRVKGGKLKWILLALVVIFAGLAILGGNDSGGSSNGNSNNALNYDDAYNELNLLQKEEYATLFSNPDGFKNRTIDIAGQVFNILSSDSGTVFQMFVDKEHNDFVIVVDPQRRTVVTIHHPTPWSWSIRRKSRINPVEVLRTDDT